MTQHKNTTDKIKEKEFKTAGKTTKQEYESSEEVQFETGFQRGLDEKIEMLWGENAYIYHVLKESETTEEAREKLFSYAEKQERSLLFKENNRHSLENVTIKDSLRVFKNILSPLHEHKTGTSAIKTLRKLAKKTASQADLGITEAFIMEFIYLFKGMSGRSDIYESGSSEYMIPDYSALKGREAAIERTKVLDNAANGLMKYFRKYPSGLEDEIRNWRRENRIRILKYFNGTEDDWKDYKWQLKHIITKPEVITDLIELSPKKTEALKKAIKNSLPVGITPYYLSLMDANASIGYDHAIRAQVLPPKDYVDILSAHRGEIDTAFDFMGEHDTSPIDLVTRRYPMISILKPFNTCAQICVYCQRNWEITECYDPQALASREKIEKALEWFDDHPGIGDILITGGDPLVMKNKRIKEILDVISQKKQVYRVRFGTRTPVVMPQRWTDELIDILKEYHNPPQMEIAIITHFEHPYEITPDSLKAVQKIRKAGMSCYNQEVFTIENSRRFETTKLRRDLKTIGIDPYYNFNMKGKEETKSYMAPIARILQERKEEARLLPGVDRTDEPVFNVPRMGKNHLRAWQDHDLVMIKPNGSRVYEFHPWEKNIAPVDTYLYSDVPIWDYLERLAKRGEDIDDYKTIWYYY